VPDAKGLAGGAARFPAALARRLHWLPVARDHAPV